MYRKTALLVILIAILFIPVCFAAKVSVSTAEIGDVDLIRIHIDPYGHSIAETEILLAEQEVLNRYSSEKIYFSEEERRLDEIKQVQQNYDIEVLTQDGKTYWKCTPKNPKTIQVKKSRSFTRESSDMIEHITEYYDEEVPNPNYLEPSELEKKVVWFEAKQVEPEKKKPKNKTQDIDGMVRY